MILREIATARAGDKGNVSQIALIARGPEYFPLLRAVATAGRMRDAFAGIVKGEIVRHEVPGLNALVFVMHGALGGGVSISLASDPHGKSFSSLALGIEIPEELVLEFASGPA